MEPALLELIAERPIKFLDWLTSVGVQTCRDLHLLWPSGASMVTEFEEAHGGQPSDEAFGMAMVYTLAGYRAHDALKSSVDVVAGERSSSSNQRPSLRLEAAPTTSIPPTVRTVIETGFKGAAPVLQACVAADPQVREEAAKQVKLNALFQLLVEDFIDLKELGMPWEALQDPIRLQKFKDMLMEAPARLGVQRLSVLISSMRRWKRWALQKGYSVRTPSPLMLSEFLKEVAAGGPTAAASMWHVFQWFADKMGCALPVDHFLVKPFKMHAVSHTSKQAMELSPGELINLILLASKAQGTRAVLLAFMVQSAVSCIRFEHMQRSSLVRDHKTWLEFRCRQGKARCKGARPAYHWSTPEIAFQGWSLCATLRDFLLHEMLPDSTFLWPALRLAPDDLWTVTDVTPFDVGRPMQRARFLELMRGSLQEANVEPSEASTSGYNRLRRFLPTLGNVLALDKDGMQALGSWAEIPAGGGPQPSKKVRATVEMSLHYAGQKTIRSAEIKRNIMARFFQVFRRKQPELALCDRGLLLRDSWTWPDFMAVNEHFGGKPFAVEPESVDVVVDDGVIEIEDGALDGITEEGAETLPVAGSAPPSPPAEAASASESDSSSSASDISADPADLVGILADTSMEIGLQWFQQGQKVHVVRIAPEEGQRIPWCRDSPFHQDPSRVGEGFSVVLRSQMCQRCLSRMPRTMYAALAEQCSWSH